jgi:ferrochelatase
MVPLSFVSDHIETLYEVDMLFAESARAAGITGYHRADALNTHPKFIDALGRLVAVHLRACDDGDLSEHRRAAALATEVA